LAKLTRFILLTRSHRIKTKYGLENIFAMDETPVWLDMQGTCLIEEIGGKSVMSDNGWMNEDLTKM
jgi:hypothetical protein